MGILDVMVIKFNLNGEVIEVFEDRKGQNVRLLSFVDEWDGVLWMSLVFMFLIWMLFFNVSVVSYL